MSSVQRIILRCLRKKGKRNRWNTGKCLTFRPQQYIQEGFFCILWSPLLWALCSLQWTHLHFCVPCVPPLLYFTLVKKFRMLALTLTPFFQSVLSQTRSMHVAGKGGQSGEQHRVWPHEFWVQRWGRSLHDSAASNPLFNQTKTWRFGFLETGGGLRTKVPLNECSNLPPPCRLLQKETG